MLSGANEFAPDAVFSVHFNRFSLLSLQKFYEIKKAAIKSVVRGLINLLEFFFDF